MWIPARRPVLSCLACLALAACFEEAPPKRNVPDIDVSGLGMAPWPPAGAAQAVDEPARAADPFAENNMIVLDMSGSMGESGCAGDHPNRAEAAKAALLSWIAANPGDNVGLVSFSADGTRLDFPLGRGAAHAEALVARIEALRADSNTPLLSAMRLAEAQLTRQAVLQGGTGAYRMIVITDGQASDGENPAPVVEGVFANPANMIEIHTIGFCIDGAHSLKDPDRVFYTDANSPDALRAGLDATRGEAADFDPAALDFEELSQ
ncbi:vWA domain-containing protein [Pseudoponticoccus marisrubri]|uniref:VWFA domain-containing protein n=1 Tax=Pseudoponticoccus marisrubri TaxID=1685382 RepID=A0A0W7WE29_9RHOB|nr:VWA domain-containing protein [Pseudoponticoccus marisrubri]KUF08760.1 hypothetical protein AVJ23_21175 [Pseudoponticoccus marisrubri]